MAANAQFIIKRLPVKPTAWKALETHFKRIREMHLRDLFANDPTRGQRMAVQGAGLYLDYSKNLITDHTLKLLIQLAEESGLQAWIDAMFRGEKINITEKSPVLHVALRASRGAGIFVEGKNVVPQVHAVLDRMSHFCNRVRRGEWKGHTGKRIRHVISIGVGGPVIGPAMACEALKYYSDRSMTFQFISNIDGTAFVEAVRELDPAETLFIITSKTFATVETMSIANAARNWLLSGLGEDPSAIAKHFVAISSNATEVGRFGIDTAHMFEMWDWVGDGYSMDSAAGMSIMLAIGPENFRDMLDGFHEMDMHFMAAPFERNLPVLLGLIYIWYTNLFAAQTVAVLPYDQYLARFPAYLQQLAMGSNGKRVTLIGTEVTRTTAPVYWGEPGTHGQHSFYQLLHQGTRFIPCDFIAFTQPLNPVGLHHEMLLANALAQAEALAFGKTAQQVQAAGTPDWLVPHKVLDGNRPSNMILGEKLTPNTLGKLVALYEHSVFTQGVIWNINPFDEWGVEFGEELAQCIVPELGDPDDSQLKHDSSTNNLIRFYRKQKQTSQ